MEEWADGTYLEQRAAAADLESGRPAFERWTVSALRRVSLRDGPLGSTT